MTKSINHAIHSQRHGTHLQHAKKKATHNEWPVFPGRVISRSEYYLQSID